MNIEQFKDFLNKQSSPEKRLLNKNSKQLKLTIAYRDLLFRVTSLTTFPMELNLTFEGAYNLKKFAFLTEYRVFTPQSVEDALFHVLLHTPFKDYVVSHERYKFDFTAVPASFLRSLLYNILSKGSERDTLVWVEPLQNLLLTKEQAYNKLNAKKRNLLVVSPPYKKKANYQSGTFKSSHPVPEDDILHDDEMPYPNGMNEDDMPQLAEVTLPFKLPNDFISAMVSSVGIEAFQQIRKNKLLLKQAFYAWKSEKDQGKKKKSISVKSPSGLTSSPDMAGPGAYIMSTGSIYSYLMDATLQSLPQKSQPDSMTASTPDW